MKSLRINSNRNLYFEKLPIPERPKAGMVQAKISYASICGYDMMMLAGKAAVPEHGVIGHEASGVVVAIGEGVATLSVGDRVTINPYVYCGKCDFCRSNRPNFCINPRLNMNLMTEVINIDAQYVYKLPDSLSLKAGCLTEPLMMAMYAVKKAYMSFGEKVLLSGCGGIGQIILKILRQHSAGKIIVLEPSAVNRKAAEKFGADLTVDPGQSNYLSVLLNSVDSSGYDVIIEASGDRLCAQNCLNLVARGGRIVYFGLYGMDYELPVNLFNLYWKDASISAVCVPSGMFPQALAISERLNLEEVISAVYDFNDAPEAFRVKAAGEQAKVMLEFKD